MPHNQYMYTPLIMWLITASMHLPPGKWNFLACTQKARSCLWRTMSETEAISYVFLVSLFLTSVDSRRLCHKDIVVLSQFCAEVIT